jgi:hypothetical protein
VLVPIALSLAVLGLLLSPGLVGRLRLVTHWATAMLAAGALFAPWLLYAAARRPERFAEGGVADLGGMAALWLNTLLIGNAVNVDAYWPVYWAALGIGLGAVVIAARTVRRPEGAPVRGSVRLFVLLAALDGILVTLAVVWALSLPLGLQFNFVPTARYLITLVPWATLALAVALAVWRARWPRAGLGLGVVSVVGMAFFASGRYSDRVLADTFRSAARTWQAYQQPGDELVLHTDIQWPEVDYYLGGDRHANIPYGRTVPNPAIAAELVGPLWDAHDAVWLFTTNDSLRVDWDRNVWRWLDERALASRSFDYGPDARLWVFARTPERAASLDQVITRPQIATDIAVGDQLRWVGFDRPLAEAQIGDALQVVTYWRTASPANALGRGLRLASVWSSAIADEIPLAIGPASRDGLVRLDTAFPIRPYVSPGLYRLQVTTGPGGPVVGPDLALVTVVPARPLPPGTSLAGSAAEMMYENGLRISGWQTTIEGDRLLVEFNYAASRILDRRWKRFVHLTGPDGDGRRWAQIDNEPLQAAPPMTAWPVEAVVVDRVTLVLPANLPAGQYRLVTGFYDPLTGTRLPVITWEGAAIGDSITLGTVAVP